MRASSPSSLFLSLTLHLGFVAAIFLATYYFAQRARDLPVIFELVAGPPTGSEELVAPALGNTLNKIQLPKVETVASMPEPEPVVPPEPEVKTVPPKPEVKAVKPPPVEKAKPKPKPAPPVAKEQRMSYQEYLKKHPTPKKTASTQPRKVAKSPRIDAQGIAQGVKGGLTTNTRGGESGKAIMREQQNQLNTYISLLIQELKKAHEPPPGVSDQLEAEVTFDITAGGAILKPRISKSSGDKAFDDSVLEAFLRVRSIGPTPNRRGDTWKVTFKMREEG